MAAILEGHEFAALQTLIANPTFSHWKKLVTGITEDQLTRIEEILEEKTGVDVKTSDEGRLIVIAIKPK